MNHPIFPFLKLLWRRNPAFLTGQLTLLIISQLIPLAQLVVAQRIIDAVVTATQTGQPLTDSWPIVLRLVLYESLLFLANAWVSRTQSLLDNWYQQKIRPMVMNMILQQVAALDVGSFDKPEVHNLLSRVWDDSHWRPYTIYQNFFNSIASATTLIASISLFLLLPKWIILVLVLIILPAILVQAKYGRARYQLDDEFQEESRRAGHIAWDLTHRYNIKEIKLYGLEPFFNGLYVKITDAIVAGFAKLVRRFLVLDMLASGLAVIGRAGITGWLVYAALTGQLTIGQLTLYTSLMLQLAGSIRGLLGSLAYLNDQTPYLQKLSSYLDLPKSLPQAAKPRALSRTKAASVVFDDVWFRYPGQLAWVLKGVSFTIEPGKHIALVGDNGAGKTTLVKLLARFYDPTKGRILINDVDIRDYALADLHAYLGIMFQDFAKFEMQVRENIGFGQVEQIADLAAVKQAASMSGAAPFIEKLPKQYESLLSLEFKEGVELSGGQWQKVGLARTFFRDARLFILDEPTAALDAAAEEHFYKQFLKMKKDVSAILISHRFSTVRMADTILVLEKGVIQEAGSHDELMRENGHYAKLFRLQAKRYQ